MFDAITGKSGLKGEPTIHIVGESKRNISTHPKIPLGKLYKFISFSELVSFRTLFIALIASVFEPLLIAGRLVISNAFGIRDLKASVVFNFFGCLGFSKWVFCNHGKRNIHVIITIFITNQTISRVAKVYDDQISRTVFMVSINVS